MMECSECHREADILFNCPDCSGPGISYCEEHRYNHTHHNEEERIAQILEENNVDIDKVYQEIWNTLGKSSFKLPEWLHLLLAIVILFYSFALANLAYRKSDPVFYYTLFIIISFTFLSHEFAHKVAARRIGLLGRFVCSGRGIFYFWKHK